MNPKSVFSYFIVLCVTISLHAAHTNRPLSAREHMVAGGVAGGLESTLSLPLIYLKNRLQQKEKISLNPAVWYRGYPFALISSMPRTALQVTLNGVCMPKHRTVTTQEKMGIATAVGATSALVSGPADSAVLYSQNTGYPVYKVMREAPLTKGLVSAMGCYGFFAAAYLAATPEIERHIASAEVNNTVTKIIAGSSAGLIITVATQPLDTTGTLVRQQVIKDYGKALPSSWQIVSDAYAKHGLKKFYSGMLPRAARNIIAVPVLNMGNSLVSDALRNRSK